MQYSTASIAGRIGATALALMLLTTAATAGFERPPTDGVPDPTISDQKKNKKKNKNAGKKLQTVMLGEEIHSGPETVWAVAIVRCPNGRGEIELTRCKRGADISGTRTDEDGDVTVIGTSGPVALVRSGSVEGFDVIALQTVDGDQILASFGIGDARRDVGKDVTGDGRVDGNDEFQVWFWSKIRGMGPEHPAWRPELDFNGDERIDQADIDCVFFEADGGATFDPKRLDRLFAPTSGPGSVEAFTKLDQEKKDSDVTLRLASAEWTRNVDDLTQPQWTITYRDGETVTTDGRAPTGAFDPVHDVDRDGSLTRDDFVALRAIRTRNGERAVPEPRIHADDPGFDEAGDVNGDGHIDGDDTLALQTAILAHESGTE